MVHSLAERIARLRAAFDRACVGDYAVQGPEDALATLDLRNMSARERHKEFNTAILRETVSAIALCHARVQAGTAYLDTVHKAGGVLAICNGDFWRDDVEAELRQSGDLFARAGHGLVFIEHGLSKLAAGEIHTGPLRRAVMDKLWLQFNGAQKSQRVLACFSAAASRAVWQTFEGPRGEKPATAPVVPAGVGAVLSVQRRAELRLALEDISHLLNRATLALRRMQFVACDLIPARGKDPAWRGRWEKDLEVAHAVGVSAVDTADRVLRNDARRHVDFVHRLTDAYTAAHHRAPH